MLERLVLKRAAQRTPTFGGFRAILMVPIVWAGILKSIEIDIIPKYGVDADF